MVDERDIPESPSATAPDRGWEKLTVRDEKVVTVGPGTPLGSKNDDDGRPVETIVSRNRFVCLNFYLLAWRTCVLHTPSRYLASLSRAGTPMAWLPNHWAGG